MDSAAAEAETVSGSDDIGVPGSIGTAALAERAAVTQDHTLTKVEVKA